MTQAVSGAEAVRNAIAKVMGSNPKVVTFGLGVNDPTRVFGTTAGLREEFGDNRVFETPTSELAMTGVGVGLAIAGFPVIHSHQRMDFALLAMDQLINSAAKWKFMFGDQFTVPYLVRMIIGRGWGQGPTHSQNLESWLAHTPGIRVLVPATPQDLSDSILAIERTADPIVLIEHRWIHGVSGEVKPSGEVLDVLGPVVHSSEMAANLTIVTWGLATFDALSAKRRLADLGVHAEVIQLRELTLANLDVLKAAVEKTANLLVVSNAWAPASFGDSIVAQFSNCAAPPARTSVVAYPHAPEPTALNQLGGFHVADWRIINAALELLGKQERVPAEAPIDQPKGYNFGPF